MSTSELKIGQSWFPSDVIPGAEWWKTTDLGGTVDEDSGSCVFPYGVRSSFTSTPSGDTTVSSNGATVSRENRAGRIIVNANNVTIQDCQNYGVYVTPGKTGTIIEYCKIAPPDFNGSQEAGVVYNEYTIRYSEVTNTFDGLKGFGNVVVDNCWVHDMSCTATNGNQGGGYNHGDGFQSGGGSGITISNSLFANTGENSGIFLFRDGAGGYGTNPITNVSITNTTITQCGNYGLWIIEASDPSIPSGDKLITNVTIDNVYVGCARSTLYAANTCATSAAPIWRGKLQVYFPTTSFTATWSNVYALNGTSSPTLIPLSNTSGGGDYCNVEIQI